MKHTLDETNINLKSGSTKRLKCLISTGLGRLHLVQSAQHLHEAGVDVEIVQGWVPRLLPDSVINLLGKIVNSKHLAAGMKKRQMTFLPSHKNHSCAWSEVLAQGLFKLSDFGLINRGTAANLGWVSFARSSTRFIHRQDVMHVRGGAGRGGVISKARNNGIKVFVDFSIAHPAFLQKTLESEYRRFNLPFTMGLEDRFWKSIIEDYEDADLVIANSHFVKETLVEQGGNADRIVVTYLGVREDFFGLKKDYSVNGVVELLFTGGFGIRKGAQYLIPALEQLVKEGVDLRMTVVGAFDEAKHLVTNSTLGSKLNCVGFIPQDDLKTHLAKADIYVFPSLAEGCASSGMEAMAAGLPVITTRESGLPITHGENGWIIPSKSDEAIVEAITHLTQDNELRERLGRKAAKTIAENYTWEHYARNVRDIYLALIKSDRNV